MFKSISRWFHSSKPAPHLKVRLSADPLDSRDCPTVVTFKPIYISSYSTAGSYVSLNPQPLPPGGAVSLNPQPLPPKISYFG